MEVNNILCKYAKEYMEESKLESFLNFSLPIEMQQARFLELNEVSEEKSCRNPKEK